MCTSQLRVAEGYILGLGGLRGRHGRCGQRRWRRVADRTALSKGDAVSKVPTAGAAVLAAFEIAQVTVLEIRG